MSSNQPIVEEEKDENAASSMAGSLASNFMVVKEGKWRLETIGLIADTELDFGFFRLSRATILCYCLRFRFRGFGLFT